MSTMMRKWRLGALAMAVLVAAGCSHDSAREDRQGGLFRAMTADLKGKVAARRAKSEGVTAPDPEAMAREALALNQGPLLFSTRENAGTGPAVLGMIGENGPMRTYATPQMQTLMLRNGLVVGTRGLGHDMMSAEVDEVATLIHARRAGTGARVIRLLDGLGTERPLPLTCTVAPAQTGAKYSFAGRDWNGTVMAEHCTGQGFDFTNSYLVTSSGQIATSRQWVTPELGYFTLQVLRP
ncbi:group 4 capsule polysaccharide lipoprotein GfcB/YjbF [Rhodobacter aestuarii]|uniref:Group 4 capsule polysaccharide lipoprotein gfcB, YjbF n=2 Tax=Rhodobacter aestuarii TaxID=453582 RepID=A0A1N7PAS5_9RHOB|nr:group 4 capsule polysaccharide lipoprotein GfcB/YjbF [Rhodobacter aestuarii]SIT07722.1 Group 4 capsule polysaccharide lipoprotein gfcB, YjbF [Rhodobacter aestuarii]